MTIREAKHETVRYPMAFRLLDVRRVQRVTANMVRVTLGGEDLAGFETRSPEDHLKLIFPVEPSAKPALPVQGATGFAYPEGVERPPMRDYTPLRFDAAAGELDIDIFVHGRGLASTWAEQAKPGQFLGIAGPRGSHLFTCDFDWYLLCGDETSIPSISRRIAELPMGVRAFVFIEVDNIADEQPMPSSADATIAWIHRDEAEPESINLVERALQWFEFPAGEGFTWLSGEATSLQSLRRYLIDTRGIPRQQISISGHWKRGAANYDHHEEIPD